VEARRSLGVTAVDDSLAVASHVGVAGEGAQRKVASRAPGKKLPRAHSARQRLVL